MYVGIYSYLGCMNMKFCQVQHAIHAPHVNWEACTSNSVYVNAQGQPGRDASVASTLSVLPNVIEKSVRTVIVHGLAVRLIDNLDRAEFN